jgi:hypothetical protein
MAVFTLTPPLKWFCQADQFVLVTGEFKCEHLFFNIIHHCSLILFHFYYLRNDIVVLTKKNKGLGNACTFIKQLSR